MNGKILKDSIFDGIVKYFDKENRNLGFSTFKYGLKNGPSVNYFQSGNKSDSINFKNGLEDGYAYKYDSLGRLLYETYYFNGLAVGGVTEFTQGKIREYYFMNFERRLIYSIKALSDSTYEEKGKEINAFMYSRSEGTGNKNILFVYLIKPPYVKTHFEIAIFDKNRKILSSKEINSQIFFYEQIVEDLADGNKYGIIFYKYNRYKNKDDLVIRLIE